jgi:acyl carrier protein
MNLRTHVDQVVAAEAGCVPPLPADARLVEDLGLNSLAVVRLLVRLEEELHGELDEAAIMAGGLKTIADLVSAFRASRRCSDG